MVNRKEEIEKLAQKKRGNLNVFRAATGYRGIIVTGNWDDLSPEPRRSIVKESLKSLRRELRDAGYTVGEIHSEYGTARITIKGR